METTNSFIIEIKTKLEDAGIKATDDQVKSLADSLEDTGKKGADADEKITEGAHKAELSHHELREAVHAVANQFGGLADVGLWLSPMTAALAAVLFMVEKVREHFKDAAEAVARLAEQTDKINEARLKGFADAANEAAESIQQMAIEQQKLNTAYAESSTAMDNRVKQYSAERDAVLKVAEAKAGAFTAEIQYEVELGRISKERADAAIAQSKLQLDSQRGAADSAKLEMEIEERKQELAKASFRLRAGSDEGNFKSSQAAEGPLAANAAASDEAAKQAATGKIKDAIIDSSGRHEEFNGTVEELQNRIAKARADQQDAEWKGNKASADGYNREAEALGKLLNKHVAYVEYLNKVAEDDKQKLTAAKAQTEQAAEQLKHDQEILRSGQDRIEVLQKQLELQKQVTREVEAQHHITAEINAHTAEHQERTRVQSGHGTAQEQIDFQDSQSRQRYAHESGPQAAIDAAALVDRARQIDMLTRGQGPQALAAYHDELHQILNGILGVTENHAAELSGMRSLLDEFTERVRNLESRSSIDRAFGH